MIETMEELVGNLRYRQSSETYGEYITRLEDIIKRWHTDHTALLHKIKESKTRLKELQKEYLKALEDCDPHSVESHYLNGRCGAMIEVMRIFVDTKMSYIKET